MSSDNTNNWLTSIEEFNQSRLKDLNDDKINKRNGNLLYLDEIRPGQDIVLKKFIGIREWPYGSKYFCIDYFDKEDKLKRIAFQAESTVGKQLSHEILNTISGSCSPGNDEYSEILIKRLNGTSIYIISWNQGNDYVRLSGDCRNNTGLSRVDEIIDKILDNKRNDDNIEMVTKDDIVFVKKNKALEAIIGKGEDNSVSEAEKEEIWRRYSEKKYYANEDIEDAGDEKVLEELEKLFHRSVQTLGDVIDERRIYHNADPEGSTELYDYISSVIYKINEPAPSASFLCAAHNFEKENNGACQSYSYEGNTWTHKIVEQDSFYELSALKLPIDQTDICNIFEELPDEIQKYINGTQFLVECNTNVWFHSIGRKTDTTFSAFFLVASKNKEIIDCFRANSNRLYDYIVYLQTVNQIERDKQINKKSSELAATAIMSRNMSHNLGSHVISYVKQSLSSVDNMFKDKVLAQLSKDETEGKQSMPFLLGLGHFFSYLQERQDFIATIATDYIPSFSTVNFKDHIYDELNPDKRYQRHSERKDLEIDNILLGNIAQSEGLGRSISSTKNASLADIVLKFRDFNGETPNSESAKKSLEEMRGYNLSIPGGVVGRQAIFSIVENVIRNAAKHGNWRDAGKLELTFDIYDYHDIDSGRVCANDNVDDKSLSLQEVLQKYYFSAKDKYDNYVITLTDNLSVSKESLGNLRRALSEKYIDPLTGTINNGNKGLKEMRISSAWLRAIDEGNSEFTLSYLSERNEFLNDEGFQNDKNWYYKADDTKNRLAPLVYARISKSDEGTQRLQYIFCVPIPKKVAVVSDEIFENGEESKLLKHGWRLYSSDVFLNKDTDKSFEFIIFDDIFYDQIVKGEDLYNRIRQKTSSRLIRLSELPPLNDLITQIKEGTLKYDEAYQAFYEHIAKCQENDRIAIQDSKATARHKDILQSVVNPSGGSYLSAADGKVSISDGIKVEPYIYRTHHDSKSEFLNFINNSAPGGVFQNFKYVEGISGNNSTDRFVRNETIDDIWLFKHLHAMKTKVAIFDERIFSKVFGLKESDFFEDIMVTDNNIRDVKSDIAKKYPEDILQLPSLRTSDAIKEYLKGKGFPKECDVNSDNFTAKVFEQKNVFVYSLIRSKVDSSVYHLVGLKEFWQNGEAGFVCHCGRIASLSWDMENKKLKIDSTTKLCTQFDKISIHQGLLDKLYTAFGIRNHKNEANMKEQLTRDFYQFFSKSEGKDAIEFLHEDSECKGWFLPGMVIHSGRSKPGEKDMPQLLPFIQYASIEHAVFDCKLSLVELLDFARYE